MPVILDTDILVLGAGLAGLRAALSAHRLDPDCRITIVALRPGPAGSSFANRNNCLGMQVCFTSGDQAELRQDILRLSRPGIVHENLVDVMTQESLSRFEDLVRLGLRFRQNDDGSWTRFSACFSPHSRRAVIFDDLGQAFSCFRSHLAGDTVSFMTGMAVSHLVNEAPGNRVLGALLTHATTGHQVAIRARATIAALGGPAAFFRHNLSGPGNTGASYALLHEAGAPLLNTSFLQIMWSETATQTFFSLQRLASSRALIGNARLPLPADLVALLPERSTHCPYGYDIPDNAVDAFLAGNLLSNETMAVCAQGHTIRISPMVHAGNGGAEIDAHGATQIPGLFACGECASGMHGANRIGGGMILATQVFGHRAGSRATEERENPDMDKKSFTQLIKNRYSRRPVTAAKEPGIPLLPGVAWRMNNGLLPQKCGSSDKFSQIRYRDHRSTTIQLIRHHYTSLIK